METHHFQLTRKYRDTSKKQLHCQDKKQSLITSTQLVLRGSLQHLQVGLASKQHDFEVFVEEVHPKRVELLIEVLAEKNMSGYARKSSLQGVPRYFPLGSYRENMQNALE